MNTNSPCSCASAGNSCDSSIAELPRYYPRQLITPDDLTLEQNYFRDRMRRHNRLLHGWGVVCGALVCPVPVPAGSDANTLFVPWQVQVQPGYVLGPYGDEIIIDCPRTVDLRTSGVSGVTGDPCVEPVDPWCSQVFTPPTATTLYIAVKYKQCMTRPVRVQPAGCGCSDTACEYSRWHDGYEIGVLQDCPPCSDTKNKPTVGFNSDGNPDLELLAEGDIPACPDCSCGPWVGLATITMNPDGSIKQIDNCACRRLVLSFSQFWWTCSGPPPVITDPNGNNQATVTADGNDVPITVTGQNFRCGVTASCDPVRVKQVQFVDPQTLNLTLSAASGTTPGSYDLTVSNIDGKDVTSTGSIAVTAKSTAPTPTPGGGFRKPPGKKTPKTTTLNP
jgi:hypothetical protein